ncbi:DEAD/DEAH box helicase [Noviherbaspirillum aridicola]|nr:DEAD/DEAH box helicase [Noviherbaspirillum aridicola]
MPDETHSSLSFAELDLGEPLLRALRDLGYEVPSPIQASAIPILLSGRDVLGQAQTGTGKTAAFALPVLARLGLEDGGLQALVLTPTRELAIQVAEAFQKYAAHLRGFRVLPVYGGQAYGPQLAALRRGVHVVVGTPGRLIDHIEKATLDLSRIRTLVLDEADEMLRMGFIDDVETILQRTPAMRQSALFSATMPAPIRRIAQTYLREPAEVTIAAKTATAVNIRQRYWLVSGMHKLDALTRILEAEPFDGMIIFVRTKLETEELAGKLQARGFAAAAINGDMAQQQRERTIGQLREGRIDILVATDVAARGLDVERISHVVNYDVPYDPESYTHRIGRTGRAGRSGEAILFIAPRERHLLKTIERATRQRITVLELPTVQAINDARIARFKDQISEALAENGLDVFRSLVEDYERERNIPAIEIAAALARMARGGTPLLLEKSGPARAEEARGGEQRRVRNAADDDPAEPGMKRYRIEVGHMHGVRPGNIVGAIANEAKLDAGHIGRIDIRDDHALVELDARLPAAALDKLGEAWVAGRQLRISEVRGPGSEAGHGREGHEPPARRSGAGHKEDSKRAKPSDPRPAVGMETYRIEVGRMHDVRPASIVGAIANEAGLEARYIGRIEILDDHSLLDLPEGMPREIMRQLQSVAVAGQPLRISRVGPAQARAGKAPKPTEPAAQARSHRKGKRGG